MHVVFEIRGSCLMWGISPVVDGGGIVVAARSKAFFTSTLVEKWSLGAGSRSSSRFELDSLVESPNSEALLWRHSVEKIFWGVHQWRAFGKDDKCNFSNSGTLLFHINFLSSKCKKYKFEISLWVCYYTNEMILCLMFSAIHDSFCMDMSSKNVYLQKNL